MTELRIRGLLDIAADGDIMSANARIHHVHSMAPGEVALPALVAGAAFLNYWTVREQPDGTSWRAPSYTCMAPATFVLRDAVVHGAAGIISVGGDVVAESLVHTDTAADGHVPGAGTLAIRPGRRTKLQGTHATVLAGGMSNYFHSALESAARLCMIPDGLLASASSVLYPRGAVHQPEMLKLPGLPASLRLRAAGAADSFLVDRLVFPWSVHGQFSYHRVVDVFFDRMSASVPESDSVFPQRFYVDRRGTGQRVLENEGDVVAALGAFGIVPVRPETFSFADQVRLFRGATLIVAPHGAGLTNIGFARPRCRVLELHMDAYVNWCFRHLAALRTVAYDCVVGRALGPWLDVPSGAVHGMRWRVSVEHVVAAVRQ